jgi:hypothetical protein
VDLTPILIVVVAVAASGAGRALAVLGRSSDVMASLFVPPDRSLGWPHGVQEQDAPWSWRGSARFADGDGGERDVEAVPVATVRLTPSVHRGPSIEDLPRPR